MTSVVMASRTVVTDRAADHASELTGTSLATLGGLVERDGLERHLPTVARVAQAGRGISPQVSAVLMDAREAEVVRLRAFAVLSVRIAQRSLLGNARGVPG